MTSILVVSAHPDDETLFSGGTLAMYAKNGHDIKFTRDFSMLFVKPQEEKNNL